MNTQPSTPLCEACLQSELYCQACMYEDNQPCCPMCVHPIDGGRPSTVAGISLQRA